MGDKQLSVISDMATEAHARIQKDFTEINPVVGVSRSMRKTGIPADAMTIDCLKSGKRIILVLHDQQPDIIHYQFSFKDKDPDEKFEAVSIEELTTEKLYEWIHVYFLGDTP